MNKLPHWIPLRIKISTNYHLFASHQFLIKFKTIKCGVATTAKSSSWRKIRYCGVKSLSFARPERKEKAVLIVVFLNCSVWFQCSTYFLLLFIFFFFQPFINNKHIQQHHSSKTKIKLKKYFLHFAAGRCRASAKSKHQLFRSTSELANIIPFVSLCPHFV